jgi:hypothetical protein
MAHRPNRRGRSNVFHEGSHARCNWSGDGRQDDLLPAENGAEFGAVEGEFEEFLAEGDAFEEGDALGDCVVEDVFLEEAGEAVVVGAAEYYAFLVKALSKRMPHTSGLTNVLAA